MFPWSGFGDIGVQFFGFFSNMAPVPRDLRHHNYYKLLREEVDLWSTFHVNWTNSCKENKFSLVIESSIVLVELNHNEESDDIMNISYYPWG